ncbi:MAG: ComEC/Rec2 family competence protein [Lachnospiraceae bacterium]
MRRPLCFIALVFAAVVYLYLSIWGHTEDRSYDQYDGESVTLTGQVTGKEFKTSSTDGTRYLLVTINDVETVPSDSFPKPQGVLVKVNIDENDPYREDEKLPIGSYARFSGTLRAFARATNPGEFDSSLYYQTLKISFRLNNVNVEAVGRTKDPLGNALYMLKRTISRILDECMVTEQDAGILKAMLLGEKGSLTPEIKDLYQESGIIHILAISGLHISLFGMGMYRLLMRIFKTAAEVFAGSGKMRMKTGKYAPGSVYISDTSVLQIATALIAIVFMLLYGKMTGMSSSSFRAVIMFIIHMGAIISHRTYDLLTATAVAAIMILIEQPLYLMYSGFLFSFGAVIGIGLFMPVFRRKETKSLAVPLVTLPVYLNFYYVFPLYSLFLNVLVIPLMTVVMLSGMATLVFGGLVMPLGKAAALADHVILFFYESICRFTAELPGHSIITGKPYAAATVCYIVMLVILVIAEFPPVIKGLWIIAALMIIMIRDTRGLELTFIDVGQGDGILISADGINITIDGGSSSKNDVGTYQIEPFLKHQGAGTIDLAILTHDDSDHCNGLITLLENDYDIRQIGLADMSENEDLKGENYRMIEELAAAGGIPVIYFERGDLISFDKLKMYCVHPDDARYEDVNEGSLTFLLTYGSFSAMLTGDLEKGGEDTCLEYIKTKENEGVLSIPEGGTTILKCGHHGSKNATGKEWLEILDPSYSVISCGTGNKYHHPSKETVERLEESGTVILDTRYSGAITVKTDVFEWCFSQ